MATQVSMRYDSPIGTLVCAAEGNALVGLWIEGQKYFEQGLAQDATAGECPVLRQTANWLDAYFRGERPAVNLPLAPQGTAFRRAVWAALLEIPYGEVMTYGELARRLTEKTGHRTSARAVGGAVGHNPISIVVPCHRVVGADGSLTGYAGGLGRKRWLLRHEKGRGC